MVLFVALSSKYSFGTYMFITLCSVLASIVVSTIAEYVSVDVKVKP